MGKSVLLGAQENISKKIDIGMLSHFARDNDEDGVSPASACLSPVKEWYVIFVWFRKSHENAESAPFNVIWIAVLLLIFSTGKKILGFFRITLMFLWDIHSFL